jgi:hypothetical protein
MATTLDRELVAQGDSVYAVGLGAGRVVELLLGDKMRVQFSTAGGSGVTRTFDSSGVQTSAPFRTLYWHDPIVAVPLKNEAKWARAVPAVKAVLDLFRNT